MQRYTGEKSELRWEWRKKQADPTPGTHTLAHKHAHTHSPSLGWPKLQGTEGHWAFLEPGHPREIFRSCRPSVAPRVSDVTRAHSGGGPLSPEP